MGVVRGGRRTGDEEFALDIDSGEGTHSDTRAPGPDRHRSSQEAPFWRRPLLWLLSGVVLIATGIITAPVPPGPSMGIIDHVAEPVQQWEVNLGYDGMPEDGEEGIVHTPEVWLAEETVLYVEPEQVTALETADGSQRWQAEGADLRCELREPTLLCVSGHDEHVELVALHLEQGEVAREPQPDLIAAIPHGQDAITVQAGSAGIIAARQNSTGEQVWSHQLHEDPLWEQEEPAEERNEVTVLDIMNEQVLVRVVGDSVDVGVILDAGTGEPQDLQGAQTVSPIASGTDTHWLLLGPGHEVLARIDDHGLHERASGSWESILAVDDGQHTEVRLESADDALRGVSARTGRTVWEHSAADGSLGRPVARLGDVLVVSATATMTGVDLDTGAERWSSAGQPTVNAYSDGEVLVVLAHLEGSTAFIGVDARSGAEQFEVEIGQPWVDDFAMDERRAVTLTAEGLALWAW